MGCDAGCANSCKMLKRSMWEDTACRFVAAGRATHHHKMYAQEQPSAALLLRDLPSPEGSHPARDHTAYVDVTLYCTVATLARFLYVTSDCESFLLCCFIACACRHLVQLMMCKHNVSGDFLTAYVMREETTSCSDACHIKYLCLLCMQASKSLN